MKKQKLKLQENQTEIINILTESDKELYQDFLNELKLHVRMGKTQSNLLIDDFNAGILYLLKTGTTFNEIAERLDPERLGGFYASPATEWYPLDNAAIVYPLSMKHGTMPMFRMSVYLKEDVIPEILQLALDFTIRRFPTFATTIKQGVFWHYMDSTKRRFNVEEEDDIPLRPIKVGHTGSQSFRLLYYRNRISAEYFHIITDGSGGLIFLKTITAEYLRLLGVNSSPTKGVLDTTAAASTSEVCNEFDKTELQDGVQGFMGRLAVQMSGKPTFVKPCQIIHFEMDSNQLRELAHESGVSVSTYLLDYMFMAGKFASQKAEGEFRIQVPVNMRKYYPSDTLRNFSMYFSCDMAMGYITDFEDMKDNIAEQIKFKSSKEEMTKMMSTTVKLISSLKYVPLIIKKPVVQIAYGFLGDRIFSSYLSNLGMTELPEEMEPYVEKFDFELGPSESCRASCAMISYKDKAVLSITKITADPSFEERLYQLLTQQGLEIKVSGSALYES